MPLWKNYQHGRCEGGNANDTALYTTEYAKRVTQCLFQEMTHKHLHQELQGETVLVKNFGEKTVCFCKVVKHHGSKTLCGHCLLKQNEHVGNMACVGVHLKHEQNEEEIKRKLYLLHAATGHSSTRHMVRALEKRGASAQIIQCAKDFRCSICEEKCKRKPHHVASLEPLPPKLHTVSADGGRWVHPETHEEFEFAVIIDEGSRFRVARVMTKGKHKTMQAADFVAYFQEGWMQYFGIPTVLRLDPSGAFRSHALENFCDEHHILLDVIPGEAHWQLGTCEQAVQGLKELMTKIVTSDHTCSVEAALAEAVRVFNHKEIIHGFSPVQHVLGQAPDETGRFVQSLGPEATDLLIPSPGLDWKTSIHRMQEAEKALAEWQAHQRIQKAMQSRAHRKMDYRPGDLVYFWRKQTKNKEASKNGMFLGPARVLCTESRRDDQGQLYPGAAVWCVRGRRLLKCSPEQLRPATSREELIEHLSEDPEVQAPWTFPRITQELGGNEYEDISQEQPDEEEWHRAQDPARQAPPRRRHTYKRPLETLGEEAEGEDPGTASSSHRGRSPASRSPRRRPTERPHDMETDYVEQQAWWTLLADEQLETTQEGTSYWTDDMATITVEIDMPDTKRGMQTAITDLQSYFVGCLKRRAIEVNEKRLSKEDFEKFQQAKGIEVSNFLAAKAFEALPPENRPNKDQVIHMRWILTWKLKDTGEYKAKARAILQGYQDPGYEYRATTTPVMTRQTRQLMLHTTAQNRWKLQKGDVSGAFLQGREYPTPLYCIPCPEILKAMNLSPGEIVKVKRGCYGLVDAPLEWYRSISEYFSQLGLIKSWADPCCWHWKPQGKLQGIIACHVDDFLFSGSEKDESWQEVLQKIKQHYKWGEWESGRFTQCGVLIEEDPRGGFWLSQPHYLDKVSELNLCSSRRKDKHALTTEWEKTKLRGILGALSWHAQQVAPHLSAEVGLFLSALSTSTVETIHQINNLLYRTKQRKEHRLKVHAFPPGCETGLFMWTDAGSQNRPGGESTQGLFLGLGPLGLLDGNLEAITPVAWHSNRIDRVTRSPGAAEAKAVVNGEDLLFHARFQVGEMKQYLPDIFDIDTTVNQVTGCVISDSRNVYDKLQNEEISAKGAERRTDLELMCVKSAQRHNGLLLRWVHSEAQIANALTKAATKELELYYKNGFHWKIVSDSQMRSTRKRKQQGLETFETNPVVDNPKRQEGDSCPGSGGMQVP